MCMESCALHAGRQAGAQGAYLEMDDPELIDGPIALSQIQEQAVRLLAAQDLNKAQWVVVTRPWQVRHAA